MPKHAKLRRYRLLPLLIDITAAILSTKVPILLGPMTRYAFWSIASDARIDFAMLMGLLFLLALGAGPWSLDALSSGDAHDRP